MYISFGIIGHDRTTLEKGAICVVFLSLSSNIRISFDAMSKESIYHTKAIESTPVRYTAMHICMPDKKIYHFFKTIILSQLSKELKQTIRIHTGSCIECNYTLKQFGIPGTYYYYLASNLEQRVNILFRCIFTIICP